jgi:hypothetical protein
LAVDFRPLFSILAVRFKQEDKETGEDEKHMVQAILPPSSLYCSLLPGPRLTPRIALSTPSRYRLLKAEGALRDALLALELRLQVGEIGQEEFVRTEVELMEKGESG